MIIIIKSYNNKWILLKRIQHSILIIIQRFISKYILKPERYLIKIMKILPNYFAIV